MTGFGRGESTAEGAVWRVEMSSVNRKQLELVVNLPRELAELEAPLRSRLAEKVSRGRVQVSINSEESARHGGAQTLLMNEALAVSYADELRRAAAAVGVSAEFTAADMIRWPGVFSLEQQGVNVESAQSRVEEAFTEALQNLVQMRHAEGLHLRDDLNRRLSALEQMLQEAQGMGPQVVERYRTALQQRLADAGLPLPLEDERLVKEIGLFADRSDISEEITRTTSHIAQFRAYMDSGEPVGRPLDFLCQELFREWNTIGSKANYAPLAQLVVRAKTELEKIREQVQNIE